MKNITQQLEDAMIVYQIVTRDNYCKIDKSTEFVMYKMTITFFSSGH